MSAKKTAWHPPFTGMLLERAPRWATVRAEVQLTTEPLRVDDVIELRADVARDPHDVGQTLRGMWRYLVVVGLLEYKSAVSPFQRGDLTRLVAYAMLWLSSRSSGERTSAHEVTMILVVPTINVALREELDDLGLTLLHDASGYHLVERAMVPLLVIDLGVVAERESDDLLRVFAGAHPRTLATRRWFRQNRHARSDTMDTHPTPDLEGYDQLLAEMLNDFTPEERLVGLTPAQRLAGLAPQERLAGLAPQERLAGLAPEETILALPDSVLRGFPQEYVDSLPERVREAVIARRRA